MPNLRENLILHLSKYSMFMMNLNQANGSGLFLLGIFTMKSCKKYTCYLLSFLYRASFQHMEWKPTDVTILFVYCRISTCFGPTGPSSGEFVQLLTQPLVQYLCLSVRVLCVLWPVLVENSHQDRPNTQSTRTERHRNWTNGCVSSCTNSPEDGPVGPKHVEIRQYTNKIVTSVGFHSITCYLVCLRNNCGTTEWTHDI